MSTRDLPRPRAGDAREKATPGPVVLQCVASAAGTLIGEALGPTLGGKVIAGMIGAAVGAFLTAPGRRHGRRIVAVALLIALLDLLRGATDALASERRRAAWAPANWAVVGVTAAVGFTAGSGITTAIGGWDDTTAAVAALVRVPEVRGVARAGAVARLEEAGFGTVIAREPSERIEDGAATRTAPPARARVEDGTDVTLFVSTGPPAARLRVPDVTGQPREEAVALLSDAGLRARTQRESSATIAAGAATRTRPRAGVEVQRGARVLLLISSGPPEAPVEVPDVAGQPRVEARRALEDVGLRPTVAQERSETVARGDATRTDPPAGAQVERNSGVTLYVSSGPPPVRVRMPDVTGQPQAQAMAAVADAGLSASTSEEPSEAVEASIVIRSDPVAGTELDEGSEVGLFVSSGPPPIVVPDVAGLEEDAALARLRGLGLAPTSSHDSSSEAPFGVAFATEPPAGSELRRGDPVRVLLGCGPTGCID